MKNFPLPKFQNPSLLQQALTHCSLSNHNQRFEWVGDEALGITVTVRLIQRFPQAREGLLTQKRSELVCNKHLAKIAKKLNLGEQLRMSPQAERQGCRHNDRVLSGAIEAIIGAYLIDSNNSYQKVEKYICALFSAYHPGQI